MASATLQGVTVLSRKKGTRRDVFELDLTPDGIAIRRPGQAPRHLPWDRVTEWEVEQRRDGVLLTLRGGGAVTPLVIPNWSVDDLDSALREATAPAAAAAPTPVTVTDPVLEEVIASEPEPAPVPRAVPGEAVPEGTLVWPDSAPLDSVGDLVWPGEEPDESGV